MLSVAAVWFDWRASRQIVLYKTQGRVYNNTLCSLVRNDFIQMESFLRCELFCRIVVISYLPE